MIEVTVRKDEIKISGHANYAVSGSDIVCAGVTALALTDDQRGKSKLQGEESGGCSKRNAAPECQIGHGERSSQDAGR